VRACHPSPSAGRSTRAHGAERATKDGKQCQAHEYRPDRSERRDWQAPSSLYGDGRDLIGIKGLLLDSKGRAACEWAEPCLVDPLGRDPVARQRRDSVFLRMDEPLATGMLSGEAQALLRQEWDLGCRIECEAAMVANRGRRAPRAIGRPQIRADDIEPVVTGKGRDLPIGRAWRLSLAGRVDRDRLFAPCRRRSATASPVDG
jgi:hypothetical protein